jgi:hypothetical protein
LNQYWYSEATINAIVKEVTDHGQGGTAFVSTPSCYFACDAASRSKHKCLDFDEKWSEDPGFVKYDFNAPIDLPADLEGTFELVVIDPPFITEEVWEKYTATAKWLLAPGGKVLCSTIAENEEMMERLLAVKPQKFRPSIPHLVYQYNFYCSYESEGLATLNPEID